MAHLAALRLLLSAVAPGLAIADAAFDDGPAGAPHDEPQPFDAARSATADVDAALENARMRGTRALFVLGGNWCHDSRAFAAYLMRPELAALVAAQFELVYVDVGRRDRNLDIAARFGVGTLSGTPTILVVSADGELLNADTVHDWRNAASRSYEEATAYLRGFAR